MRTLKFIVENQVLKRDPACDFGGLSPGGGGNLRAEFSFSKDWNGYTKVISFWSPLGQEYPARILKNGVSCDIPEEALKKRSFKIQVHGAAGQSPLTTNKLVIKQNGGAES